MNRFILVVIKLIVICNLVNAISDYNDDFGEKVKNKRRQLIRTPAKNVKKTSLLQRLLAVKNDFENSEEDSRSIDYRPDKNEEDRIPTREELIKKLKFVSGTIQIVHPLYSVDFIAAHSTRLAEKIDIINDESKAFICFQK